MGNDHFMSLSQLPGEILPDLWRAYCDLSASEADAIASLNTRGVRWLAATGKVDVDQGRDVDGQSARAVERGKIDGQIVETIRQQLVTRQLVATGLQPPALNRVEIPGSLWTDLDPDFAQNSAANSHYAFTHIEVQSTRDDSTARIEACKEWLMKQVRRTKTELRHDAFSHIPGLKSREFDAAYQAVFKTRRGRPHKNPQK